MLVKIINNDVSNLVFISNSKKENDFLLQNPDYLQTDFNFTEDLNLYEYDGTTFNLIDGWEQIKADELEAERIANLPTFEEAKQLAIDKLHDEYQMHYDEYLSQYPAREVATFPTKQNEAMAWNLDNTTPTPTIDAMVQNDPIKRTELLYAVIAKVNYLAVQEGEMVAKRDSIKACTTIEDLKAIEFWQLLLKKISVLSFPNIGINGI